MAFGCATAIAVAAPASATVLSPTPESLPDSLFRGADGNQADAPSLGFIDWQALQAAGRVVHNPDPNAQDSAFTGGSKEDEPGAWGLTAEPGGVNPPRATSSTPGRPSTSRNTFLYLGFTRQGPERSRRLLREGTTFLTFELNHDERLWDNGRALIPCRRTGDVLVSYEQQGIDVDVVLQRWFTTRPMRHRDARRPAGWTGSPASNRTWTPRGQSTPVRSQACSG